jgi:hypothetical protein
MIITKKTLIAPCLATILKLDVYKSAYNLSKIIVWVGGALLGKRGALLGKWSGPFILTFSC